MAYDNTDFISSNPGRYNIKVKDVNIDSTLGISFKDYLNKMSSAYTFADETYLNLEKFLSSAGAKAAGEYNDGGLTKESVLKGYFNKTSDNDNLIKVIQNGNKYDGTNASYINSFNTYTANNGISDLKIILPGTVERTEHVTPNLTYSTSRYWTITRSKSNISISKWVSSPSNGYFSSEVYNYSFGSTSLNYSTPLRLYVILQAGGGGGGGYNSSNRGGGGGGGGGGLLCISLNFATHDSYLIELGDGGYKGNGYNTSGRDGGDTIVWTGNNPNYYKGSKIAWASGGRGGYSTGGGDVSGGAGGYGGTVSHDGLITYRIGLIYMRNGGSGGKGWKSDSSPAAAGSTPDKYASSGHEHFGYIYPPYGSGGSVVDTWAGGGGGSAFGNGNTETYGSGGHGGYSGDGHGQNGGAGMFRVYY